MNERNAYEKHLADKLQSLPPPGDAKRNWPHMKALLDRDMPEAGHKPRGGKWWLFGSIIAVVITAGMLFLYRENTDNTAMAQQPATTGNIEATSSETGNKTTDGGNGKQRTVQPASANGQSNSSPNESDEKKTLHNSNYTNDPNYANKADDDKIIKSAENLKIADNIKASGNSTGNTSPANENPEPAATGNTVKTNFSKDSKRSGSANRMNGRSGKKPEPEKSTGANTSLSKDDRALSSGSVVKQTSQRKQANPGSAEYVKTSETDINMENEEVSPEASNRSFTDRMENGASIKASLLAGDSIRRDYPSMAVTNERSRFRMKTDRVKSLKNRVVGTGENKNFVVGLTFPLGFPLSDQRALAYNVNARANTISDFLPAPNIQYHFSQKSYFQAEVQFASPQFIEPALLSVKHYELGPGNYYRFVTSSVFARKLYYFNLPLEVHYSPFKNFYLGSGLQFSSLMSGVGYAEDRGSNSMGPQSRDSVFRQRYFKFSNDSLSSRLNGNEVRVLLDANYYWKKFTVGLRYNQAVNSYINIQVNNNLPPYSERNKTLQFYLRYNIWENRKK